MTSTALTLFLLTPALISCLPTQHQQVCIAFPVTHSCLICNYRSLSFLSLIFFKVFAIYYQIRFPNALLYEKTSIEECIFFANENTLGFHFTITKMTIVKDSNKRQILKRLWGKKNHTLLMEMSMNVSQKKYK